MKTIHLFEVRVILGCKDPERKTKGGWRTPQHNVSEAFILEERRFVPSVNRSEFVSLPFVYTEPAAADERARVPAIIQSKNDHSGKSRL